MKLFQLFDIVINHNEQLTSYLLGKIHGIMPKSFYGSYYSRFPIACIGLHIWAHSSLHIYVEANIIMNNYYHTCCSIVKVHVYGHIYHFILVHTLIHVL